MLTTLINKITDILSANSLIQEVYNFETEEFKGDPASIVIPSSNDADYRTSNENERIYSYVIRLYVSRTTRGDNPAKEADRVLRNVVDSVLDDFDKDYLFSGLSTPTGYTMINVFALPSAWGYAGREDEYRVAEVTIKCRVYVDVTQIS